MQNNLAFCRSQNNFMREYFRAYYEDPIGAINKSSHICNKLDEARALIQMANAYRKEHDLDDAGYIFSVQTDTPLSYYSIMKAYRRYCDIMQIIAMTANPRRKELS